MKKKKENNQHQVHNVAVSTRPARISGRGVVHVVVVGRRTFCDIPGSIVCVAWDGGVLGIFFNYRFLWMFGDVPATTPLHGKAHIMHV